MKPILFIFLSAMPVLIKAQFKIGNITIDSLTASKYFIDLYAHPDTVDLRSEYYYDPNKEGAHSVTYDQMHTWAEQARGFNENVIKYNIGTYHSEIRWPDRYLMPRKPTEQDFVKWFNTIHH